MTTKKREALVKRQTWVLTPGEQVRLAGLRTREGVRFARDKDTSKVEGQIDAIWATAADRIAAEEAAVEAAARKKREEKAAAKAARKVQWW